MFKLVTVALFTLVQVTVYCRPRAKSLDVVEQSISSVKVNAEKLLPPDHVDALKFEKDGHINKDYRKEIFLGNHEEMDDDPIEIAEAKLVDIFHKIDVDADGYLSDSELEQWILDRINAHMDEAVEENDAVFKHLDPDGDGFVEWKEYYKHFLLAKGHGVKETEKYLEDYDTDILKEDERDQLVRYKFKWTDADIDPIDNKLDKKEFFSFRHPEQSPQLVENMIMSIINSLDEDKDGNLTLKEFMTNSDEMMQEEGSEKERKEEREVRKREFESAIDKNKDGIATKQELIRMSEAEIQALKRGRAYQCLDCEDPMPKYIGERRQVIAHLYKYHVPLDRVPYYCSLCHFLTAEKDKLAAHVKGYVKHVEAVKTLESSGRPLENYLRANPNPVLLVEGVHFIRLSREESRQHWMGVNSSKTPTAPTPVPSVTPVPTSKTAIPALDTPPMPSFTPVNLAFEDLLEDDFKYLDPFLLGDTAPQVADMAGFMPEPILDGANAAPYCISNGSEIGTSEKVGTETERASRGSGNEGGSGPPEKGGTETGKVSKDRGSEDGSVQIKRVEAATGEREDQKDEVKRQAPRKENQMRKRKRSNSDSSDSSESSESSDSSREGVSGEKEEGRDHEERIIQELQKTNQHLFLIYTCLNEMNNRMKEQGRTLERVVGTLRLPDRENRESRESRENREDRESRESRENREGRESRENREDRESREIRENREDRESRVDRENRGNREDRESRVDRGNREDRESRVDRENRGNREDRESRVDRENYLEYHQRQREGGYWRRGRGSGRNAWRNGK